MKIIVKKNKEKVMVNKSFSSMKFKKYVLTDYPCKLFLFLILGFLSHKADIDIFKCTKPTILYPW